MNNEVEDIISLFDEFFIIEGEEQLPAKPAEAVAADPGLPVKNIPAQPVVPAEPEPPVLPEPEQPASKEPIMPALNYSGANKRHIAIIYNDKNNDSRENVEMISNLITKALKFSMDDVAVVRTSRNPEFPLTHVFDVLGAKYAIVWGLPASAEDSVLDVPVHTLVKTGAAQVLVADFVNEYHGKAEHKARLWEAVQKLFAA